MSEQTLTRQEWEDLREQLYVLLDVTWDYSANVARLGQLSLKRQRDEKPEAYDKRVRQDYQERFKQTKQDSFERVVAVLGYMKKLGLPRDLWPKEIEIKR
jgi:thymidylate kinase